MQTIFFDLNLVLLLIAILGLFAFLLAALIYIGFTLFRYRDREERSVNSVLLSVAVPRGNEIKIDAMEQLFASLYSIKKGGWKQKFSFQPAISF